MPRWLFNLLGLKADERGAMQTMTKTRTTTRTAVVLGVAGAAMVAAAAFTFSGQLTQQSPITSTTPSTNTVSAALTNCSVRISKDPATPSTIRIASTPQTLALLRVENTGDRPCEFDEVTASGNLVALNRTAISARQITILEGATQLGRVSTGNAVLYSGSNYAAAYRMPMRKSAKIVIPGHGTVVWRVNMVTATIPKTLLLDLFVSLNTTPGGNVPGAPIDFKVTTIQ